jgi:hypothetical protein
LGPFIRIPIFLLTLSIYSCMLSKCIY